MHKMMSTNDQRALSDIRNQTLSILEGVLDGAREVVIIDAPNQRNIGDSLIWEGELAYLKLLGVRIKYATDIRGYDSRDVRRRLPVDGGVVLLHGGGNFGDLWEGHQRLRERVVQELPEYKIVQLSQSIFFADESRAALANARLANHKNFVTLIRDSLSMERAATQLPGVKTIFCPDMALGYTPIVPEGETPTRAPALAIARADHESASGLQGIPETWLDGIAIEKTDWARVAGFSPQWKFARRIAWFDWQIKRLRRKTGAPIPVVPANLMLRVLGVLNRRNVKDAVRLYVGREIIVVDRLHAHVLASLLGIPNVLLDNNYKKLGGVFDDYTGRFETATYVVGLDDARAATIEVLER
ncbi:putative pyruvyl transferase EpsO [Microbacterium nanhaiense]|uniref:Pyruvyl transferase EpsO n=1 Tax=Microbacterium nanhaiense TaxID=1301026 RepID=A0ABQ2N4J5_9MICO|nr:polysaccharide pyruvyl transferase family protein [Microbacterium nanhaiense]GGO66938.1 putative pyruvyl transferase EpsO [Microbacterium nanhaiense]